MKFKKQKLLLVLKDSQLKIEILIFQKNILQSLFVPPQEAVVAASAKASRKDGVFASSKCVTCVSLKKSLQREVVKAKMLK